MTGLDFALLAVVGVSALIGLLRGLIKEALSLAIWIGSAWAALQWGHVGASLLTAFIDDASMRLWAGRLLVFVGLVFGGSVVTWTVGYLIRNSPITGADRALGLLFGVGRGLLVVGLLALALQLGGFADESWWRQSKLIPYAAAVGQALKEVADRRVVQSGGPRLEVATELP